MSQEVGSGYVTLLPSAKGFGKRVESEMGGAWDNAEKQGSSAFSGLFKKVTGFASAAAVAVAGYFSAKAIFGGGLSRLLNIEDAQAKLKGLGHDTESIAGIMTSALDSVRGTFYRLDDAATIAAGAVAAGVQPGADLTKYLKLTADASTIAGISLGEMGSIFNKVTTQGRAYTQELNQLADRGIPIYQWLADEYGVTTEALRDMVAKGEVDAATYRKVIEENIGGAALSAGDTTRGALANMGAALGRVGANLLGGVFPLFKETFKGITDLLGPVETWAKRVGDALGTELTGGITAMKSAFAEGGDVTSSGFAGFLERIGLLARGAVDAFTGADGGIFDGLLAAAQSVFGQIVDWLSTGGINSIADTLLASRQSLFDAALQIFPAILDAAVTLLPAIVNWVTGSAVPQIIATVTGAVPQIIALVGDILSGLIVAVTALLPSLVTAAVDLFMALVGAVIEIAPVLIQAVADLLPRIVMALLGMLPTLLTAAIDLFMALVNAVIQILPVLLTTLLAIIPPLLTTLVGMIPALLEAAITVFMALVDGVLAILPMLIQAIFDILPPLLETLLGMLPTLLTAAIDFFFALVNAVLEILPQLLETLTGTVLPGLIETLTKMIPDLIETAIDLFMALVDGLLEVLPDLLETIIVDVIPALIQAIIDGIPLMLGAGKELLQGIWNGLEEKWPEIKDWLLGLPQKALDALGDLGAWLYDAGKQIIEGLKKGIKDAAANLGQAVWEPVNNGINWLKDKLGIRSPSRVAMGIGENWSLGLIEGIDSQALRLSRSVAEATGVLDVNVNPAGPTPNSMPTAAAMAFLSDEQVDFLVRTLAAAVAAGSAEGVTSGLAGTRTLSRMLNGVDGG